MEVGRQSDRSSFSDSMRDSFLPRSRSHLFTMEALQIRVYRPRRFLECWCDRIRHVCLAHLARQLPNFVVGQQTRVLLLKMTNSRYIKGYWRELLIGNI
jgi:hypothetical protein